jgi:hypothetical protein
MRAEVAADLRRVFDADEPADAERRHRDVVARYQKPAPQLAAWLEENVPEALTVLRVPASTGGGSARPTALNDSTTRSNDAPASPSSSPTRLRSCDSPPQSCPRSAMTGKPNVPT